MIGSRVRNSRTMRVAAAFFCLPIFLVFGSAGNAAAAAQTLTYSFDDKTAIGADYTCETVFSVNVVGEGVYGKLSEGYCGGGVDTTPGTCGSAGEPGCTDVAFVVNGVTSTGQSCSVPIDVGYPTAGPHDSWSYKQIVWTGGGRYIDNCDPEEVCLTLIFDGWSSDEWKVRCAATSLDLPDVPIDGECDYGTWAAFGNAEAGAVEGVGSTWRVKKHYGEILFDGSVKAGRWFPYYIMARPVFVGLGVGYPNALAADYSSGGETTPPATASWGTQRTFTSGVAPGVWGWSDGTSTLYPFARYAEAIDLGDDPLVLSEPAAVMVHQFPVNGHDEYWKKGSDPNNPTEQREVDHEWQIIGVGVYDRNKGMQTGTWEGTFAGNTSNGALGRNDPSTCAFYWGEKVWDDPNSTADEPAGDVNPVPGSDDEPEPPPPTPPAPEDEPDAPTDDTGLLDGIWKVLRDLLGAIYGLAGAIGGLVADMVKQLLSLFIPKPSSWDLDGLMDEVEARPPFSVFSGLGDGVQAMVTAYQGSGDCGTIADFGGDMQIECSAIKSVPGHGGLYALVSGGMVMLTGMGIFNSFTAMIERGQS